MQTEDCEEVFPESIAVRFTRDSLPSGDSCAENGFSIYQYFYESNTMNSTFSLLDYEAQLSAVMDFPITDVTSWPLWFGLVFCGGIMIGLEVLSILPHLLCDNIVYKSPTIKVKGKHLDELSSQDNLFIFINKMLTILFVYHVIVVINMNPRIAWALEDATIANTVGSLLAFYVFYDFFYMNFHRLLHVPALYPLVHKHHHRQKAPSRGNLDAINVHPFEFVVGEYLHLLTVFVIPSHIIAVTVFILAAGVFASLNHTRYDIDIPYLYNVRAHDVHHGVDVRANYAQYTMFWDHLFGTFRGSLPGGEVKSAKKD